MYAVITENDISEWNDKTGSQYHYPNKYQRILSPGTKVVYYKGKIQDKSFERSRLSKHPHYFGIAEIGKIYTDPENPKNYYSDIVNYIPFSKAVSFKDENGDYIEQIPENKKGNYWRDAVRSISKDVYERIISLSEIEVSDGPIKRKKPKIKEYPQVSDVQLSLVNEDLLEYSAKKMPNKSNQNKESSSSYEHYSNNAQEIGDRGEEIVHNHLQKSLTKGESSTLRWLAQEGITPGYDIEYKDSKGNLICIEVKATTAKRFPNFYFTKNELLAAEKYGDNYKIYLVADCLSKNPKLSIIENIAEKRDLDYDLEPITYKVTRIK